MSEVHGAHIFHLLQVQLVKCFLILMNHVAVHKLMMKVITGGKEQILNLSIMRRIG